MRSLLHRLLIATWVGWGAVACGGGGSSGNITTAPNRPLQDLRELSLHAGSLQVGGCGRQDGNGTAASLGAPGPLAIDGSGRIHVMDPHLGVRVVDAQAVSAPISAPAGHRRTGLRVSASSGLAGHRHRSRWQPLLCVLNDLRLPPNYLYRPRAGASTAPVAMVRRVVCRPTRQAQPIEVGNTISGMALDSQGRLLVADPRPARYVASNWIAASPLFSTPAASADPAGCLGIHGRHRGQ
jgi:hypothetical protein